MLTGTSAGLLQLMHPALGAGVAEHSAFFEDPWGRILRSIPQIWATIFAADEDEGASRGRAIRDIHRHINGVDDHGRRYHALDPEVFWWDMAQAAKAPEVVLERRRACYTSSPRSSSGRRGTPCAS